mmetsp:Transcript_132737/g.331140  ORF Transcript_132737/g.331140 Transcript_132737/m.331140 type:complete len:356 (-) Transcript_132737:177-1244(-)
MRHARSGLSLRSGLRHARSGLSLRSTFRRVRSGLTLREGLEHTRTVLEFELEFQAQLESASRNQVLRNLAMMSLFMGTPVLNALRGIAFKLGAQQVDVEIAAIAPAMFGSLVAGSCLLTILMASGGIAEACRLLDRKYLVSSLPALFSGFGWISMNFALLSGTGPTVMILMLKCMILPSILGEIIITKQLPYATQALAAIALMFCIGSFVLQGGDNQLGGVSGMLWAAAVPLSMTFGNFLLEIVARKYAAEAENGLGEKIRVLFMNEFWKAVFQAMLLLTFEWDFVTQGLVNGWTLGFVAGSVLSFPLSILCYNSCIIMAGTLRTSIFASADIGLAYLLEGMAFSDPPTQLTANT